ncbi:glyoxylase-like metal-dependent hydrolase (beta-lactamase superfamily II) [Brevibacterium sanguinis]|uniref:Glyoxylase-like metal-dependent hydrolase (Beta-lactamase superfamily II) n=2 Tax=Brevibacterium TaxID=1696 RepID=A0A366IEA8_9MICO|nr:MULTISPECIES: MBL fold metallo-hydrolase [Brevibacterium]RBP62503.1 glyoxylase-like metal-dependent hydrolase (beta-lactamase superfamily II) [Brevibacterium sanguinis]RBP69167.1 glyoxylase-like metal-dependent hydrolase (beta-lactamase superfamily II) [Brevibacterium celere]
MAIEALSPQQSQAWKDRILPEVESVADGVWAIPVPIPDNPLVYTYSYAIADGPGVVLIDAGWDGAEQFGALTSALGSLGFAVTDIRGIAITHYHRDHVGLVPALLRAHPDMWVAMHGEDVRALERFASKTVDLGTGIDPGINIARAYGVPEERWAEIESLQLGGRSGGSLVDLRLDGLPEGLLVLGDGDDLPVDAGSIRSLWTPGHTYGHSVFVRDEDGLLFSGDHVLPTITPNIGLDSAAITHSLGDYLGSLEKISALAPDISVLPAHGFRFRGLHDRTRELVDHHEERLDEIRSRLDETDDHRVYSIAQGLRWSRGFEELHRFNLFAALAETAAHMHYLGLEVGVGALAGR